jgi:hypothetical protein
VDFSPAGFSVSCFYFSSFRGNDLPEGGPKIRFRMSELLNEFHGRD